MPERFFAIFPGTTSDGDPGEPIDVHAVAVLHGPGPRTVNNPGAGTGGQVFLVMAVASPGIQSSGSYVVPAGFTEVPFDYPSVGGSFVPRCRVVTKVDEGEPTFTFGFSGTVNQSCAVVVLDGVATSIVATPVPTINTATSTGFPGLATVDGMLLLPMAAQQEADDLLSGPGEGLINNTASTGNRGLWVGRTRADSSSTQLDPATWSGSVGAHVQWVIGAVGEQGVGANQLIPPSEWTALVEGTRPDSWNENRNCQLIAVGNRFQAGDRFDDINDPAGGYGKSLDVNDELHSFALEGLGAETLRLGPRPITGLVNRTVGLRQYHQWRNGDGYVSTAETAGGQNNSTAYPGTDRTYYDGTRTQFSYIPTSAADPKAIRATFGGGGGDVVILSSVFQVESWMLRNHLAAMGGGIHASGSAPSPWTQMVGQGSLRFITRDKRSAPWSSSNSSVDDAVRASVGLSAGDVGDWLGVIVEFNIDPIDGFVRWWVAKGSAGFSLVYEKTGGYGLSYADTDPNQDKFYALLANHYGWHRANSSVALYNWDDTDGNVRKLDYAYSGFRVNPTFTVADVMGHANYDLIGA